MPTHAPMHFFTKDVFVMPDLEVRILCIREARVAELFNNCAENLGFGYTAWGAKSETICVVWLSFPDRPVGSTLTRNWRKTDMFQSWRIVLVNLLSSPMFTCMLPRRLPEISLRRNLFGSRPRLEGSGLSQVISTIRKKKVRRCCVWPMGRQLIGMATLMILPFSTRDRERKRWYGPCSLQIRCENTTRQQCELPSDHAMVACGLSTNLGRHEYSSIVIHLVDHILQVDLRQIRHSVLSGRKG